MSNTPNYVLKKEVKTSTQTPTPKSDGSSLMPAALTHNSLLKGLLANAVFNIITDMVLLVLPLTIIWGLKKMTWLAKMGLSFAFFLGGLTVIASICRLQAYLVWDDKDPNCTFLQATSQ